MSGVNEQIIRLLLEYAGGLEEAAKRFREGLASLVQERIIPEASKAVGERVWSWNPDAIIWVEASGPSGGYQLATAENNQGNTDFQELLRDLEAHQGRLTRNGYFYWSFQQKPFVGRKKRE